jgi:branched-chain amino acid transport system substrate-binding protein
MKKTGIYLLAVLLTLAFVSNNLMAAQEPRKLILGHLNSFSGGTSLYGADSKRAITLALEEINAKGGVTVAGQRYLIDVIHMDHKNNPAATVAAYRRLVDSDGVRFIHIMGTVPGKAVMQSNEKDQVLLDVISPTETLNQTGNKLVLNQVVRPSGYDPPIVKEAIKRGLKRVSLIVDDSDFGKEHAGVIMKTFEKEGGKVLSVEYMKTGTEVDFMPVLTKIKGLNPDCLYLVAYEEPGIRIAKQARESGIKAKLIFTEHFKQKTIDSLGRDKLEGTLFTGSYSTFSSITVEGTPEKCIKYHERYLKRWPGTYLSSTGIYGYNWVYYVTKAMQLAGSTTDVFKVRAMSGRAIHEGSGELTMDYGGFTKGGRAYGQPSYVMGIDSGKVRIITGVPYPKELAEAGEK